MIKWYQQAGFLLCGFEPDGSGFYSLEAMTLQQKQISEVCSALLFLFPGE